MTCATIFSTSVDGARKSRASKAGSGNAFRSSFPDAFNGNSLSTTTAAGIMYDGNNVDANTRNSWESTPDSALGTT
ncbi:hypothetical protein BKP42_24030 [Rhodococcus erythropolis]|nr:hypothetical protein BKP42_24030 [Rhodococcus erythropolis]